MDISIIVPVFNEQENVLPLTREVIGAMKGSSGSYEVVFVDDCSSDATWERIQQAQQNDPRVRGLRHSRNCGQSAALWTGFQATSSPIIATLDGDLQNDAADLPRMIKQLASVDFVSGYRAKRADSWIRRISSKIARLARRVALKVDVQDSGCAIRVFRRATLSAAFPFNGFHRFLPILVATAGFKTLEVPVNHRARTAGVSKYGVGNRLWRGIFDLFGVKWFQKRRLPAVGVTSTDKTAIKNASEP